MKNLKAKSVLFMFVVWFTLSGFVVYNIYQRLKNLQDTPLFKPYGLDEIINKNR